MSPKVTISVLMAVYNTPYELVKRALDSVMNQDFKDFELLVIDDGSALDLSQKLIQYGMAYEDKISYIRSQNVGQSIAVNRAVHFAKGEYITIIDSDDEYKSNHLSSCLLEMKHADLISSLTETVVSSSEDYYVVDKHDLQKNIHVDDCILFATLFGKREVFKTIHFENRYSADSYFYEQASKKYKVKKSPSRTYIYYRNIASSITALHKQSRSLQP
ncbi:Glycosyltransferase involved in cell wall bisynthesis [Algoriphagus faecimaris]|uniref:Glycosyltransferase involved in cell wall bisynthesis n=1 Tax=Algoriphagus faecimaris TaxID=686796 RepID=A0A1G6RYX9_9BACT|nr:glycosyltransferase family A protein [Algoriphagus faecimaris]SDD09633.1 Glycosyltransferase involved in cell wall bisynthesis [Algoriphagus faecimaris]